MKLAKVAPKLTVGKIDATANDWPTEQFPVKGYPTLFFKPAGKAPMPYDGPREVDDMAKFIHDHATNKFDLPGADKKGKKKAKK